MKSERGEMGPERRRGRVRQARWSSVSVRSLVNRDWHAKDRTPPRGPAQQERLDERARELFRPSLGHGRARYLADFFAALAAGLHGGVQGRTEDTEGCPDEPPGEGLALGGEGVEGALEAEGRGEEHDEGLHDGHGPDRARATRERRNRIPSWLEPMASSYIVVFKPVAQQSLIDDLATLAESQGAVIKHRYTSVVIRGFACTASEELRKQLEQHPSVEYVGQSPTSRVPSAHPRRARRASGDLGDTALHELYYNTATARSLERKSNLQRAVDARPALLHVHRHRTRFSRDDDVLPPTLDDPPSPPTELLFVHRDPRSAPYNRSVPQREHACLPREPEREDLPVHVAWERAREELEHLRSQLGRLGVPERARGSRAREQVELSK